MASFADTAATNAWYTSSYSGPNGECVQGRLRHGDMVEIGDSKDPNGSTLMFPNAVFDNFVSDLRSGKFDLA